MIKDVRIRFYRIATFGVDWAATQWLLFDNMFGMNPIKIEWTPARGHDPYWKSTDPAGLAGTITVHNDANPVNMEVEIHRVDGTAESFQVAPNEDRSRTGSGWFYIRVGFTDYPAGSLPCTGSITIVPSCVEAIRQRALRHKEMADEYAALLSELKA